jgi:hypothetical protein
LTNGSTIDSRFKFVLFGFRKQLAEGIFDAAFMLHDLDVLADPEKYSVQIPERLIGRFSPGTLSIMEFRSQRDLAAVTKIYDSGPLLSEVIDNLWTPVLKSEEFNMTHARGLFNEDGTGWPLYEGKMMHQFTHQYAEPSYWVDTVEGQAELARREIKHVEEALDILLPSQPKGTTRQQRIATLLKTRQRGPFTGDDVRTAAEAPRLVFRSIAASTNERTLIATILPQYVFTGNSLNYLHPWQFDAQKAINYPDDIKESYMPSLPAAILTYLCGILNSFVIDYVLRFKVSANVNIFYIYQLPVPRLLPDDPHCQAIAQRVARLVCIGPEFDTLRREVLGTAEVHVATNPIERQRLQNQIDALVVHLYGLQEEELRHILYAPYTFPLVGREVKDGVMAAFSRVEEMLEER